MKVEGPLAIETVNLATHLHREWRFCPKNPDLQVFAGYVIEVVEIERGPCQDIGPADEQYHIVRGKDLKRDKTAYLPVSDVTNLDGDDRPVLAKNCHNNQADTSVICDGEPFTQEVGYAKPTR